MKLIQFNINLLVKKHFETGIFDFETWTIILNYEPFEIKINPLFLYLEYTSIKDKEIKAKIKAFKSDLKALYISRYGLYHTVVKKWAKKLNLKIKDLIINEIQFTFTINNHKYDINDINNIGFLVYDKEYSINELILIKVIQKTLKDYYLIN